MKKNLKRKIKSLISITFAIAFTFTSFADPIYIDEDLFTIKRASKGSKITFNEPYLYGGIYYVKDSNKPDWDGYYSFDDDGYWDGADVGEDDTAVKVSGGHWYQDNTGWFYQEGQVDNSSDEEKEVNEEDEEVTDDDYFKTNWELYPVSNSLIFGSTDEKGQGFYNENQLVGSYIGYSFENDSADARGNTKADTHITNYSKGSSKIKVGIIDTYFYEHPHYASNIKGRYDSLNSQEISSFTSIQSRYNLHESSTDYSSTHQHGSHVAGIVKNVAPNVELYLAATGRWEASENAFMFFPEDINAAYAWMVSKGCRVINLSLGGLTSTPLSTNQNTLRTWYKDFPLNNPSINVVIAAGNEGSQLSENKYNNVAGLNPYSTNGITVMNYRMDGNRCKHSNYSSIPICDIAAPGEAIYSSVGVNGFSYKSGTSMATPYVTGAICRMLENNPGLTSSEIKQKLQSSYPYIDFNKLK